MIRSIYLSVIIVAASSPIFAGDRSSYEILGFSGDGRYVAFERFGAMDGSGAPYSTVFIVDISSNSYAVMPFSEVLEPSADASVDEARRQALATAADALARFGIVRGSLGKSLWKATPGSVVEQVRFVWRKQIAELRLMEMEVEVDCDPAGAGRIFDLTVYYDDGVTQTLQKDTELPASRACAFSYAIEEVILLKNAIAVVVNISSTGFEGPDERQILVTGILEM